MGQQRFVKTCKLPRQEDPLLCSAAKSRQQQPTLGFFKPRPQTAALLLILSVLVSEWQMVTVLQMLQRSCSSDVCTARPRYFCRWNRVA